MWINFISRIFHTFTIIRHHLSPRNVWPIRQFKLFLYSHFIESFLDLSLEMIHSHAVPLDKTWLHCGKVTISCSTFEWIFVHYTVFMKSPWFFMEFFDSNQMKYPDPYRKSMFTNPSWGLGVRVILQKIFC